MGSLDWVVYNPRKPDQEAMGGLIVGSIPCHACQQPLALKLNKNLMAYATCNGIHNESSSTCSAQYKFGRIHSTMIRKEWGKPKPANDEITGKIGNEKKPANDETGPANDETGTDGAGAGTGTDGGGWFPDC